MGLCCKFYLQQNGVTYTYYINLLEVIISHQKTRQISKKRCLEKYCSCDFKACQILASHPERAIWKKLTTDNKYKNERFWFFIHETMSLSFLSYIIQKSALLKKRESHFSLFWLMVFCIISPFWVKFLITLTNNLSQISMLAKNGIWIFYSKIYNKIFTLFKISFLAASQCFVKLFHLQQS